MFQGLGQQYQKDEKTKEILQNIAAYPEFCTLLNKLYIKGNGRMQLYIPSGDYKDLVLRECQYTHYAGHMMVRKTADLIQRDYYWPAILQDVTTYVQKCEECQRNKPSNQRKAGLLQLLAVPAHRWERVNMDFVTHLPKTRQGYDAMLVIVDYLTKMMILRPTHSTVTGVHTAIIFVDAVIRIHGLPKVIVSNRDTRFTSRFWREVFKIKGKSLAMSSGFHPQTDGQTESANRSIKEMMRAYVGKRHNGWDERLGMVEFAYNNSVHSPSGFSPFYLCYGRHPVSPITQLVQAESKNEAADSFLR